MCWRVCTFHGGSCVQPRVGLSEGACGHTCVSPSQSVVVHPQAGVREGVGDYPSARGSPLPCALCMCHVSVLLLPHECSSRPGAERLNCGLEDELLVGFAHSQSSVGWIRCRGRDPQHSCFLRATPTLFVTRVCVSLSSPFDGIYLTIALLCPRNPTLQAERERRGTAGGKRSLTFN